MAIRLKTTQEAAQLRGVKMLCYGEAGVGKTTLCTTCPAPVIISAEGGLLSIADSGLPVIEIQSVDDLAEAHQWALESEEARQFKTICIDSLSEIAEVVLANAKRQVKDARQAYGELLEKMMMATRAFRDLPGFHVFMTAKVEPLKDEMTGVVKWGPSMPGSKLGPQLPYLFDEVFRLGIGQTPQGESYRFIQTQPDIQFVAKDRSGKLDAVEEPHIGRIIEKITGQVLTPDQ